MAGTQAVGTVAVGRSEVRKSLDRLDYHLARGARGGKGVAREIAYLDRLHGQTVRLGAKAMGTNYIAAPKASFGQKAAGALASGDGRTIGRTKSSILADFSADGLQPARDWTRVSELPWVWTANASACPTCLSKHGSKRTGSFTPSHPSCLCIPTALKPDGSYRPDIASDVRPLSQDELISTAREYGDPRYHKKLRDLEQGLLKMDDIAALENVNETLRGAQAVAQHLAKGEVRLQGGFPQASTQGASGVPKATSGTQRAGIDTSLDTEEFWKLEDGQWHPERAKLHDDIVKKYLDDMEDGSDFVMTGGGSASGKSTMIEGRPELFPKSGLIDSDDIKKFLPEYNDLLYADDWRAAAFAHEEASYLSKRIISEALAREKTMLYDSLGDSGIVKLSKKIDEARAAGHRVVANYASNDLDLALKLSHRRGLKTGRFVPEEVITSGHADVTDTFIDGLRLRKFDEATLWDTNIKGVPRMAGQWVDDTFTIIDEDLFRAFVEKGRRSYDEVIALLEDSGVYRRVDDIPQWKPKMTRAEADDFVRGSSYTDEVYHGTGERSANGILTEGHRTSEVSMFGDGVYVAPDESLTVRWAERHSYQGNPPAVVKAKVKLENPLYWDDLPSPEQLATHLLDDPTYRIMYDGPFSASREVFDAAAASIDDDLADALRRAYRRRIDDIGKSYDDPWGAIFADEMQASGYDGIVVRFTDDAYEGFRKAAGGDQLVVFDPQRVASYDVTVSPEVVTTPGERINRLLSRVTEEKT